MTSLVCHCICDIGSVVAGVASVYLLLTMSSVHSNGMVRLFVYGFCCALRFTVFFCSKHDDDDEGWMWLVRQTDAQRVHSNTLLPLLVRFQFRFYDGVMFFSTSFVLMNLTAARLRINSIVVVACVCFYTCGVWIYLTMKIHHRRRRRRHSFWNRILELVDV